MKGISFIKVEVIASAYGLLLCHYVLTVEPSFVIDNASKH